MEYHYIIRNLRLPVSAGEEEICAAGVRRAVSAGAEVLSSALHKRSVDARKKKDLQFVCSVDLALASPLTEAAAAKLDAIPVEKAEFSVERGSEPLAGRPVVVGFGPCGMFASLLLAENGYRPIVIERGGSIGEREAATARFFREQILDENCNIQFGAGGAGSFSDGKCVTRVNDPLCRYVLSRLVEFGAPESLLTLAKPHIGTDRLRKVVNGVEARVRALGGEIHYRTKMQKIRSAGGRVVSLLTDRGEIPCGPCVLAIGHSARDTYGMLLEEGFSVQPKDFSVGVRIEQLQSSIDEAMYGRNAEISKTGHAEYALSHRRGERGVYTFCMCPGGEVVAAASEQGGVVVNGMSRYARDGKNANSAIAVSVLKKDFGNTPEGAIAFQRTLERRAYLLGGGDFYAPMQTVDDFLGGKKGSLPGRVQPSYMESGKVRPADLAQLLPPFVTEMLQEGLRLFDRKVKGFAAPDGILTGVETRTSAPLRILREEETLTAPGYDNLYPGGEGAGYAGGITSAALDGLRIAGKIIGRYR